MYSSHFFIKARCSADDEDDFASPSFYQVVLKKGLAVKGENGHGTLDKITSSAIENHIAIVLNFCLSVGFRLADAEPIDISVIAISIIVLCSMPKKRICR